MSNKTLTIENLLDAGLHFGHQTKRWNPKMKPYIHGAKGGIHIIDLQKTLVHMKIAQEFLTDTIMNGRKVLFVGTKKQARSIIQEAAEKSGQPYVIHRWLGGMLTNNQTVRLSVKRMEELQAFFNNEEEMKAYSKKEQSMLRRELVKFERNLTGIKDMTSLPGAMLVVDINREKLAIAEAQRLGIPVVALVDTNTNPELVEYPIPGNDDSIRSLTLIAEALGGTITEAYDTYAKAKAAEDKRRKEKADEEKAVADKAAAERKAKEDEEKKKRAKVLEKMKAEKAKLDKEKKKEADKVAFKAKEDADAALKAKEEADAAAAAVVVEEAAPAVEAEVAAAPVVEEAVVVEEAAPVVEAEVVAASVVEEVVVAEEVAPVAEEAADEEKKED